MNALKGSSFCGDGHASADRSGRERCIRRRLRPAACAQLARRPRIGSCVTDGLAATTDRNVGAESKEPLAHRLAKAGTPSGDKDPLTRHQLRIEHVARRIERLWLTVFRRLHKKARLAAHDGGQTSCCAATRLQASGLWRENAPSVYPLRVELVTMPHRPLRLQADIQRAYVGCPSTGPGVHHGSQRNRRSAGAMEQGKDRWSEGAVQTEGHLGTAGSPANGQSGS